MTIAPELLDILVCPRCRNEVKLTPEENALHCATCRVSYPIRDNIPIMLADAAIPDGPEQQSGETSADET